jgi:hypothetical protein
MNKAHAARKSQDSVLSVDITMNALRHLNIIRMTQASIGYALIVESPASTTRFLMSACAMPTLSSKEAYLTCSNACVAAEWQFSAKLPYAIVRSLHMHHDAHYKFGLHDHLQDLLVALLGSNMKWLGTQIPNSLSENVSDRHVLVDTHVLNDSLKLCQQTS